MYTMTLGGVGSGGYSTMTLETLELDPVPVIESKHYVDIGNTPHHFMAVRYKYMAKFHPFKTHDAGIHTTEEMLALVAFVSDANDGTLQITECTLPRWNDNTNFPTLYGLLPITVVVTGFSTALAAEQGWNTFTLEMLAV